MDKKKIIKWAILGIIIGILVPVSLKQKDGGTVIYKATLYQVIDLHRLNSWSETGYDTGKIIKVMGIEIYNSVKKNDVSVNELNRLNKEILEKTSDYENFMGSYVDEYKKEILIGLKEKNDEEIEKFQKEVSDSKYLSFVEVRENKLTVLYMYIQSGTLTNSSAVITIDDIGEESHEYDSSFIIEKNDNDKWVPLNYLNKEPDWNNYTFTPNGKGIIQELNWKDIYGELPVGTYRIVKKILITDTGKTGELITEFNIFE